MSVAVPYATTGQQLGETRQAMTKTLMRDVEDIVNKLSKCENKYYILVHAKRDWINHGAIHIKTMIWFRIKPPMMLSCLLFGVDNKTGKLTLEWSLPGSWPTWSVEDANEPIPEVIASVNELGKICPIDNIIPDWGS